jgi:hypothetical protein
MFGMGSMLHIFCVSAQCDMQQMFGVFFSRTEKDQHQIMKLSALETKTARMIVSRANMEDDEIIAVDDHDNDLSL